MQSDAAPRPGIGARIGYVTRFELKGTLEKSRRGWRAARCAALTLSQGKRRFNLALTILFLLLLVWRLSSGGLDVVAVAFFWLFGFFLFYAVNYRTLIIRLTAKSLKLKFGIFTWTVPLDNIEECRLDEIPVLVRMGGAGIHFMLIRKRYRASFNFLEHPRVVIAFKRKAGLVRDISFSTRQPDYVLRCIQEVASAA